MMKPSGLAVLAVPRVRPSQLSFRETAAWTLGTGSLVVEHAHTAAYFPFAGIASCADANDDTRRLVRGDYGQFGPELAVENLKVRVAEPGCVDFNEEFMISNFRDVFLG